MSDHHKIRGGRKQRFLGTALGWMLLILGSTLRIEIVDRAGVDTKLVDGSQPVLWSFWHNTIFVMPGLK